MDESEKKVQALNEELNKKMEEYQKVKKMYEQADKRNLQKMEYSEILSIASTMTKLEKNLDKFEEIIKKYKTQQKMYEEYKAKEKEAYEALANFHNSEDYSDLTIRKIKEQEYRTKLSMYKNFSNDMFNGLTNLEREIVNNYKLVTNSKELELLEKYSYNSEKEETPEQLTNNPENSENQNDINDKYRDLTLEEAKKVLDLPNKVELLTEEEQKFIYDLIVRTGLQDQKELVNLAKKIAGISEKTDNSIENNNYRDLTLEEAQKLVKYGNKYKDGTEEEKIELKPIIDDLMQKTGITEYKDLAARAQEIVDNNVKEGNFIEDPAEFVKNINDVSQLTEEQAASIRNELGLAAETPLENKHLNEMGARLMAEQPLKEEPEKKTLKERFKATKIGQALGRLDNAIAENAGKAVMAAIAIGAVALTGGLALSAAGLTVGGATMLGGAGVGIATYNKGTTLR